jgi:ABC-type spermidine/putrescine transport system permease subunit II
MPSIQHFPKPASGAWPVAVPLLLLAFGGVPLALYCDKYELFGKPSIHLLLVVSVAIPLGCSTLAVTVLILAIRRRQQTRKTWILVTLSLGAIAFPFFLLFHIFRWTH